MTFMRSNAHRSLRPVALPLLMAGLFVSLFGLAGCKPPEFIGSRYDNFTAYYNTFYNAERQFETGYKSLDRFDEVVNREQYLPLFVKTTGMSTSKEFEQTVLKSANLLREHPDSKWVDDALLLIGKSYFYQENYVGAVQKFSEVVSMDTRLADEARFWLARALITSGAFEEALEELTLAMAAEDADREWVAQDRLLLAELAIQQELWEEAAEHLEAGVEAVKNKELAARAAFLLGQVQETLERYPEAVAAYRDVRNYTAPYELDFAARYSAARVDGRFVNPERGLAEVRRLERDDKNVSKLGELRYLRARILQELGAIDDALVLYDELLYDPLALPPGASIGTLRGRIHYALAELYKDQLGDYVLAAAYYDSAATAVRSGGASRTTGRTVAANANALQAPEAITDAQELKDSYGRFARVHESVARYDSLLWLASLSPEAYAEKIMELRQQRAAELEEQRRILAERQREAAFREGAANSDQLTDFRGQPGKVIPSFDDPTGTAGGYLFHKDPIRAQEGRQAFQNIWGRRPRVPNWRRSAAITTTQSELSEEELAEQEAALEEVKPDVLPEVDDSAVPKDSTAQAKMRAERASARYELGNVLFLGMSEPDSAAVWYRTVIEEDADEIVAPRAQYALAEVQRALGDSLAAVRLYRDLLSTYPESDFIPDVRQRLGLDPDLGVRPDSSAMALRAFERAILLKEADQDHAMDSLLTVAILWEAFPESPRAAWAAGQLHLLHASADSAAIFAPIRHAVAPELMHRLWPKRFPIDTASVATVVPDGAVVEDTVRPDSTGERTGIEPDFEPVIQDDVAADSLAMPDPDPAADSLAMPDPVPAADSLAMPNLVQAADSTLVAEAVVADEMEPVVADSLVATPADSSLTGLPVAKTGDAADTPQAQKPVGDRAPEPFRIEDILDYVLAKSDRTPLADRAKKLKAALDELKTPPPPPAPDSTLLAADSLGMATDSLAVAAADSSGIDPLAEFQPPAEALPDSLVLAMVEQARRKSEEEQRNVPRPARPAEVNYEVDAEGIRLSWTLRPMLPNGSLDYEAQGYTFVLGSFNSLPAAQAQVRQMTTQLASTGEPLLLLTNDALEHTQFLVSWGLFPDAESRDAALVKWAGILPESRNLLHLMQAE
jgi:TolA-binding protein